MVDLFLADAVQHLIQRDNVPDVGLQADQNTVDQISLFQHDWVGTSLLLGGTVIIDVLFALDRVGFPGHVPAVAAAYQQAGEQIDHLTVRVSRLEIF